MEGVVFSSNVLKALDAWSVPNDWAHSWQLWELPALPVGRGSCMGVSWEADSRLGQSA